jgi:hypothetical protein
MNDGARFLLSRSVIEQNLRLQIQLSFSNDDRFALEAGVDGGCRWNCHVVASSRLSARELLGQQAAVALRTSSAAASVWVGRDKCTSWGAWISVDTMLVEENQGAPEALRWHHRRDYYALHGKQVHVPAGLTVRRTAAMLTWHNENPYLG